MVAISAVFGSMNCMKYNGIGCNNYLSCHLFIHPYFVTLVWVNDNFFFTH